MLNLGYDEILIIGYDVGGLAVIAPIAVLGNQLLAVMIALHSNGAARYIVMQWLVA